MNSRIYNIPYVFSVYFKNRRCDSVVTVYCTYYDVVLYMTIVPVAAHFGCVQGRGGRTPPTW